MDAMPNEARRRVVIEAVTPAVEGGRFPIKRIIGEDVVVEADVFADGHDVVTAVLRHRPPDGEWREAPMTALGNDRWRGSFEVDHLGEHAYAIWAWVDRFGTWWRDLLKRAEAGLDLALDLEEGAHLVEQTAKRASGDDRAALRSWAARLRDRWAPELTAEAEAELQPIMAAHADRRHATRSPKLGIVVDRERARFGSWYELFPRSTATDAGRHGTFADTEKRLAYVAEMGFDVLYLPPIHPIGVTHRKGRNNDPAGAHGAPGVPWAIGSDEGGHTAVHPDLGTLMELDRLVDAAAEQGIEIALDVAFQCSPDHPWVREHPEWFRRRPDGSIRYAENPPKRYEDIYPLDFETGDWRALWEELKGVVEFWITHGVRIFRVDNPHTKPYAFWEWLIGGIKRDHPDVIFLSEAFTRPKVMHRLAKLGFTQSYTYFAWRNTKAELEEYFGRDLPAVADFFRPNLWPNTPDILTEQLQTGGRAAFMSRVVLAATLGASYGIYGPAFELMESTPRQPGSEEYLDSEKYEIKAWDLDRPDSLRPFIARVNRIRRENPALQSDRTLRFHHTDNEQLVAYSKRSGDDVVLTVVNLDPKWTQSGWVELPLRGLGIDPAHPFPVEDLLTGERFTWDGGRNFVEIDPDLVPAHILLVRPRVRTERDFEYFM